MNKKMQFNGLDNILKMKNEVKLCIVMILLLFEENLINHLIHLSNYSHPDGIGFLANDN
jgi:hypothetical protein